MKKTLMLLACTALLAASLTACGEGPAENTDTGAAASSSDASAKPEGLDDVSEGDSVTVTYKGTVSEADPFDGTVISVEKN